MAEINGVQWARLWARAWKNPKDGFKDLLETNPIEAARQFQAECAEEKSGYAPFPVPSPAPYPPINLDYMDEYGQPGVNFKDRTEAELDAVIRHGTASRLRSEWFSPDRLQKALKDGTLKIH